MLSSSPKSVSCLRRCTVCSGMFPLICSCLKWELMLDKDYDGKTVLMHAASSGRPAVFKQLFTVMNENIEEKKVSQNLTRCRDTILAFYFSFLYKPFRRYLLVWYAFDSNVTMEKFHFHLSRPAHHDKPRDISSPRYVRIATGTFGLHPDSLAPTPPRLASAYSQFIAHTLKDSDDGRTILMHAARSGNHRALSAVVLACKKRITPCEVRLRLSHVTLMLFLGPPSLRYRHASSSPPFSQRLDGVTRLESSKPPPSICAAG